VHTITCRDCGNTLEATARGCPVCALNFEVERRIDRFVFRLLLPSVVALGVIVALAIYLR
jgi:hypothetical protein